MSKRRTRTALVVAFVVMGVAVLGLAAAVYAKYIASITDKTASAEVAAWAFKEDNESTELKCDLTGTYKANTLEAGKIAPGTQGTCDVVLSNENSDVAVDYTIVVSKMTGPKNLVFTYDDGKTVPTDGIKGTIAPGAKDVKVSIDWEWPYYKNDTDDAEDTVDGRTAAGNATTGTDTMDVTFSISGVQTKPTE